MRKLLCPMMFTSRSSLAHTSTSLSIIRECDFGPDHRLESAALCNIVIRRLEWAINDTLHHVADMFFLFSNHLHAPSSSLFHGHISASMR
jgi:hypothetical protein